MIFPELFPQPVHVAFHSVRVQTLFVTPDFAKKFLLAYGTVSQHQIA